MLRVSRGIEKDQGSKESTEHPAHSAGTLQSGEDGVGLGSQLSGPWGWTQGNYPEGGELGCTCVLAIATRWHWDGSRGTVCARFSSCLPGCAGLQPAPCKPQQPRGDSQPSPGTAPRPCFTQDWPLGNCLDWVPRREREENHLGNAGSEWPDPAPAQGPARVTVRVNTPGCCQRIIPGADTLAPGCQPGRLGLGGRPGHPGPSPGDRVLGWEPGLPPSPSLRLQLFLLRPAAPGAAGCRMQPLAQAEPPPTQPKAMGKLPS